MRKIIAAAAIAAALAWAQGARAEDKGSDKQQKVQQHGSQSGGTAAGHESAAGGTDRSSRELRSDARADSNPANRHGAFEGKKNFDVDGKVSRASANELTIERKGGLPPATLKLGSGTKVEVDGKRAAATQLQPGQDVKASFNLRGGSAEAVEVKAKKAKADDQSKLQQQRQDNQNDRMKEQQK